MRRWIVPGVPFALSLVLAAFTVGSTVSWQDSGFFLAGVKDLGVVYAPGFVLYLISCRLWTALLPGMDFALAVHLFSSFCAAVAAGAIALAARELLPAEEPASSGLPARNDLAALGAGCLAASGYSFWSAALLAKSYALLYAILGLLAWRLARADRLRRSRDFTMVAVLIGLAWAAHPSATGVGLALLLFVGVHGRLLGVRGIAWRAALAAAFALGPSLLLPALAARHPRVMFADPSTPGTWFSYLAGGAFLRRSGVFGFDAWRWSHALRYLWEELLGAGLLLALLGLWQLWRRDRRRFFFLAAWGLPSALLAICFRIEGQLDLWLVVSWIPLYLAVAVGLASLPARFPRGGVVALLAAAVAWSVLADGAAVSMRGYGLAERFGRFHLESLEPRSLLILESDDALSTCLYLQEVRGFRKDVLVIDAERLAHPWYVEHLRRLDPSLRPGEAPGARAFAEANVATDRPVYFESPPPDLPGVVPWKTLLRLPAPGESPGFLIDQSIRGKEFRLDRRRERGIRLRVVGESLVVEPESYEHRWIAMAARQDEQAGRYSFRSGTPDGYRRALPYFEAARADDPAGVSPELVHLIGACQFLLQRYDRAEPVLREALRMDLTPRQRLRTCIYLESICRIEGRGPEAARYRELAIIAVGSDPELKREYGQALR